MKKLFGLDEEPLPALANTSYSWRIERVIVGAVLQIESNDLPPELDEKAKMLKINVSVTDDTAAANLIQNLISNVSSVAIEFQQWNKTQGMLIGDAVVNGVRLSEALISNGHAQQL